MSAASLLVLLSIASVATGFVRPSGPTAWLGAGLVAIGTALLVGRALLARRQAAARWRARR